MKKFILIIFPIILILSGGWKTKRNQFNPAMIARYKGMLRNRPDDGFAFRKLMSLYQSFSSLDRLILEYKNSLSKNTKSYELNVILGRIYLKIDRLSKSKQLFENAIKLSPKRFEAYKNIGKLFLKKTEYAKARKNLDLALKFVKTKRIKERLLRELVRISVLGGDIDGGSRYFEMLLKIRPGDFQSRWDFADLLSRGLHFKKALIQYKILYKMVRGDTRRKVRVIKARGKIFEKMGKDLKAVKTYWKAMSFTARGHWVRHELISRLVSIARRRDELPELLKDFRRRWRHPDGFQFSIMAQICGEIGKFDKSVYYYHKAISKSPHNVDYRLELISLLEKSGTDPEKIIKEREALVKSSPGQLKFAVELAAKYEKIGKPKKALRIVNSLLRRNPNDASLILALADLFSQWNKPDRVIKMYKKLIRIEPGDSEHYINLGQQYWGRGKRKKALKVWKNLLKPGMFPKKEDAYFTLGTLFMEIGQTKKALSNVDKALKIKSDNINFLFLKGKLLIKLRSLRKAGRIFELTLMLSEKQHNVVMARKVRKSLLKLWQELRILPRELAKRRKYWVPSKVDLGMFLADGYTILGKWNDAELIYLKMRKSSPELSEPLLGLIDLYESVGKYKKLINILKEAINLIPHRAQEFYERLSSTYAVLGNDNLARKYLSLALIKGARDSKAWAKAGELAIKLNDYLSAIKSYKKAISLDPYEMDYYFSLASLYLQKGFIKESSLIYHQIISKSSEDELVERAGLYAIDIDELSNNLDGLEKVVHPLSFSYSHRPVFGKLLLKIYKRYIPYLSKLKNSHKSSEKRRWAAKELKRLSSRALKPLLEALTSDSISSMISSLHILEKLENRNSAVPIIRVAVRIWKEASRKHRKKTKILSRLEKKYIQEAIVTVSKLDSKKTIKELEFFTNQKKDPTISFLSLWAISVIDPTRKEIVKSLSSSNNINKVKLACFTLGFKKKYQKQIQRLILDKNKKLDVRIGCLKAYIYSFPVSNKLNFVKKLSIYAKSIEMRRSALKLTTFVVSKKDLDDKIFDYLTESPRLKDNYAMGILLSSNDLNRKNFIIAKSPLVSLNVIPWKDSWLSKVADKDKLLKILYPNASKLSGKIMGLTAWTPTNFGYNKKSINEGVRIVIPRPALKSSKCSNIQILSKSFKKQIDRILDSNLRNKMNLLNIFNKNLSLKGFNRFCKGGRANKFYSEIFNYVERRLKTTVSKNYSLQQKIQFLKLISHKIGLLKVLMKDTSEESRGQLLRKLSLAQYTPNGSWVKLLNNAKNQVEKILLIKMLTTKKNKNSLKIIRTVINSNNLILSSLGLELLDKFEFNPNILFPIVRGSSLTLAKLAWNLLKRRYPLSITKLKKLLNPGLIENLNEEIKQN